MRVFQQGQADGLCGLYAVMHFLNGTEWRDKPNKALWYLLDACRHFGWLTPQHLTEGFEDHELKAILDLQISNYRLPYTTHFLSDALRATGAKSYRDLTNKIIAKGGSVIVQNQTGGHWLLVAPQKDGALVLDSGNYENPQSPLGNRRLSEEGWGVALLPATRPKIQIAV